jgi:hypothetical protein
LIVKRVAKLYFPHVDWKFSSHDRLQGLGLVKRLLLKGAFDVYLVF